MKKISVLLTCFNRKAKTLSCLAALFNSRLSSEYKLSVFLVDDASTDGTAKYVQKYFMQVHIIPGTGKLFWNRGMLTAWEEALVEKNDFVLWLNDDTIIEKDALTKMLETHLALVSKTGRGGIVVGATKSKFGELTYGGVVRPNRKMPTTFKKLPVSDVPQSCITMNGNCVLISSAVYQEIGILDGAYQHSMGDFDYGLRASKAGFSIWVAPGFIGTCENDHSIQGSYHDTTLPLMTRWEKIISKRGLPLKDWRLFCQRHAGFFWPVFWVWPYVNLLISSARKKK